MRLTVAVSETISMVVLAGGLLGLSVAGLLKKKK